MTNIQYTGKVNIKTFFNNKLIDISNLHNEGKQPLFTSICYALLGKNSNVQIPNKLNVKVENNYILNSSIELTAGKINEISDNNCSLSYTATISYDNISNDAVIDNTYLVLLSNNTELAIVKLPDVAVERINNLKQVFGAVTVIEWILNFGNMPEEENNG